MATHKALVLHSHDKPLTLESVPRPTAGAGEAVVQILVANIVPYMAEVLNGTRPYPMSLPMTPGGDAIGRVVEVGPDAVKLTPGQLVFCDITIHGRDSATVTILFGLHGGGYPAAQKLMDGPWRNAAFAEYTTFPLENLHPLNESLLLDKMGYSLTDLSLIPVCAVPFGGLSEADIKPGEVVIIAPATGRYGGAAVAVALAMGATVVAAGRNADALKNLEKIHASTGRLRTVVVTADSARNTGLFREAAGLPDGADAYLDFSPPTVPDSSLLTAGVGALRPFGRCIIQGGMLGKVELPYIEIMLKSLRLQGRFMYSRDQVMRLIQMVEAGLLPLGEKAGVTETQVFGLEEAGQALEAAAKLTGWGGNVCFKP
ncbi:putative isopropanol dehydrogenase [Aspergillus lucknowensis]|uniref:Chaperonin 10-like protein n=1 Tax=Aspergillus lucknowensis TaxID=176173 RepID=A0ABR4LF83_9EURO